MNDKPLFVGDPVLSGDYFDGYIVARFRTRSNEERFVVEHADINGLLRIFNREQLTYRKGETK